MCAEKIFASLIKFESVRTKQSFGHGRAIEITLIRHNEGYGNDAD